MNRKNPKRRPHSNRRDGAALVELAVCLPLLALLIGGTVETCNLLFLQNSIASAAYAGTLEVSKVEATEDSVRAKVQETLDVSGVRNGAIFVTGQGGESFSTRQKGDLVFVRVRVPTASNSMLQGFLTPVPNLQVRQAAIR